MNQNQGYIANTKKETVEATSMKGYYKEKCQSWNSAKEIPLA